MALILNQTEPAKNKRVSALRSNLLAAPKALGSAWPKLLGRGDKGSKYVRSWWQKGLIGVGPRCRAGPKLLDLGGSRVQFDF
jgi:hypothetical protein